ncbi:MAG TPA: mannose-6-phosphate isomerase [Flavobacterium sp.]|uniref:type I phosphomannose isomerase catalytic subunit n=1 Tax=unclassified Flavobacterium TaxID=196869 RepID=UPI000E969A16|nr:MULTISPECIES: type I phosphomannose isomerase catalytic subunit [unclassified Flavobacterium]HBI01574.1 mannose-6-phosphate isomerase [Flavobacterium sp.]HRE79315.1 mannose-6-phosphate isomerase [Flavobacterium sp.]
MKPFYPLTFEPIFKERIWGGTKLKDYLNKPISSEITGESWELSTVPESISVVNNGELKGKNLNELIDLYPKEILGKEVFNQFGKQFPLLFKYLDAKTDLSIQLHPNDELAKARHNSFGKTEMWYVMQADENARLIVGFKENSSKEAYLQKLESNDILSLLNEIPVKKGDVFLLETGTIHAIGAGIVIAEIQQTSDITYRIYDWDRVDANGNKRELHTELAIDAINYKTTAAKKEYTATENKSTSIVDCPYFKTNIIPLNGEISINKNDDSFMVLMCTEGSFEMHLNDEKYMYQTGDTVLIPAVLTSFMLRGKTTLLEITV